MATATTPLLVESALTTDKPNKEKRKAARKASKQADGVDRQKKKAEKREKGERGVIAAARLERLEKKGADVSPERMEKFKSMLVRDSFTLPTGDYQLLQQLGKRAVALQRPVQKAQLLRAGLHALASLSDAQFNATLDMAPAVKTGRPAKKNVDDATPA